ncbi:hypothetical protein GE107_17160 [Cohnella sp. CFH 77786]|nr:hypothetical protein [Cohnella sp. CFH 77786]
MTDGTAVATSPMEMAELAGESFPASGRVPGTAGEGFDLAAWTAALSSRFPSAFAAPSAPTHLIVKAADEFEAVVPWDQLKGAFFLFSQDGAPLAKGGPLRLYVPDGTSACLNVKSVTDIRFAADPGRGNEASYGFRNEISPVRLSQGFKAGNRS